jgi:hypothetical protein
MNYLVDECFREEVEKYRWSLCKGYLQRAVPVYDGSGKYVSTRREQQHVFVWSLAGRPLPSGQLTIDHSNGNPLDNRLENLRLATKRLQSLNCRKKRKGDLPRGVLHYGRLKSRPYRAQIAHASLGYFATPEEASAAYEAELARQMSIEETRVQELIHA